MSPEFEPPREATPEQAAVTGGIPAAAEPPPQTRARRSSVAGFAWLSAVTGVILVIVGLVANQDSAGQIGTIVAGVTLTGAALLTMRGLIEPALFAALLFLGGLVLAVAAFTDSDFGAAQAALVAAAAVTFLGAFGSLASARGVASRSAADEPAAGVENV
jgi:hypothetical protein